MHEEKQAIVIFRDNLIYQDFLELIEVIQLISTILLIKDTIISLNIFIKRKPYQSVEIVYSRCKDILQQKNSRGIQASNFLLTNITRKRVVTTKDLGRIITIKYKSSNIIKLIFIQLKEDISQLVVYIYLLFLILVHVIL